MPSFVCDLLWRTRKSYHIPPPAVNDGMKDREEFSHEILMLLFLYSQETVVKYARNRETKNTMREETIMEKKLYKSRTNKKVAGVCGGIGEYFNIDPTLVRLGFVALSFLAGGGLLVYIIAAIIIPDQVDE